jgi:hypothetical protein
MEREHSKPVTVITASQIPSGCRCTWTVQHHSWGGDVRITWLLAMIESSCPLHGKLDVVYPIDTDS